MKSPNISKAYPRGAGRWACKIKLTDRWTWAPRADSPEEAAIAAQHVMRSVYTTFEGPESAPPDSIGCSRTQIKC